MAAPLQRKGNATEMNFRRAALVVTAMCLLVGAARPAGADWALTSPGSGYGKATSLSAGTTPTTSVAGRNVTVTWTKVSLPDGSGVAGYRVRRYNASSGTEATISSSCDVVVSTLTCTEDGVAAGSWRYGITPVQGNWIGAEETLSSAVTVSGPAMNFSSDTNVTSLPSTLDGNLSGFVSGASVVFRLDNPTSGTVLSGSTSPAAIPTSGAASFSVTIPVGTTNGSHTVFAIGNQGDVASATFSVSVTGPTATDVQTVNGGGGQTGRANQGDIVRATYSEALDVSSLCATWSNNALSQVLNTDNLVQVTINDNAVGGNDQLVVTILGACGGGFRFGSVNLGSASFITGGAAVFSGVGTAKSTVAWDPATKQLTVTLGAKSSGPTPARVNSSVTATYTPDPGIRNPASGAITGTVSRTAVQF